MFVMFDCLYYVFLLYRITDKVLVCGLLFVLLPHVCSVLCFCWTTFVCRRFSFLLMWRLYFQFANNSHVVRITLLPVGLLDFLFARLLVRKLRLFVWYVLVFACMVLHMKYLVAGCCLLFTRTSVLCCVSVELCFFLLSLFSFWLIWWLYLHLANSKVILTVLSFDFSVCTVTCS